MNIKHTGPFDLAYRFVTETNLNIFLTGKAGTGKTTFLKYLRENSHKKMVVAAPTGVAAINAGGVTLHSLFQLPFAPFIPDNYEKRENYSPQSFSNGKVDSSMRRTSNEFGIPTPFNPQNTFSETVNAHSLLSRIHFKRDKLTLLRNLELLVIDEVSMLAGHTLDAIDTLLRSVRRNHKHPFGGTQVLFIGDLHQLPPVIKNQEWELLKNHYPSIFFFDSMVLRKHVPEMIELTEIFRQQDGSFIEILNGIRNNNLTLENFNLLNSRLKHHYIPDEKEGYITLTTHNQQAFEINRQKLEKLTSASEIYQADIEGDYPEFLYPAEKELTLKKGAQVMFLRNDTERKRFFNGKIGTVTGLGDDFIKVLCKGEEEEIFVSLFEWKNVKYSIHPDTHQMVEQEIGLFRQYPLRLAWAITIHKSQGLTFQKLIVDAENAFANGQVYVALSRCTSLGGLILTSKVNQRFLGAHQNLKDWEEKNSNGKDLESEFHSSRQLFAQQELQNIFSWKNLIFEMQRLKEVLVANTEGLNLACFPWVEELGENLKPLQTTADKFNDLIVTLAKQNPNIEENQPLQQRVKDAAVYFSTQFINWKQKFLNHPITTDKRKISRDVDPVLDEIFILISEILHKLNYCKNGFVLNDYLKQGKKWEATGEKVQGSYCMTQVTQVIRITEDTENPVLYERIAEMRNRIAGETDGSLYTIFPNKTIRNICSFLPQNRYDLFLVKGIGKVKANKYGDELLRLVNQYCAENNINQKIFRKEKTSRETQSSTLEETLKIFREGKKIDEIAHVRNLTIGTIEDHFAQMIKLELVQIDELMPMEEVYKIAELFPSGVQHYHLSEIKSKFPESENITYGKLKMVFEWMQREGVGER